MLAIYLAPMPFQESLYFERNAILQGQWYRLISCHFVHADLTHLLLNLPVLLVVGLICESFWGRRYSFIILGSILLGSIAVSAWLWFSAPNIKYIGMSAAALTFMMVIVYEIYRETGNKWLLLIPLYYFSKNLFQLDYPIYGERGPLTSYTAHNAALIAGIFWVFIHRIVIFFKTRTKAITMS